jgi:hypothetical protein
MALGSQVYHGMRFKFVKTPFDQKLVTNIPHNKPMSLILLKVLYGNAISSISELVNVQNLVTADQQVPYQIRSNETSATCDENSHGDSLLLLC